MTSTAPWLSARSRSPWTELPTRSISRARTNIAEFQAAIGGFIESARKVKATSNGQRQRGASPTDPRARRERLNEVREWARKNGYNVSDRGRVSAEVLAAFENQSSATAAAG